MDAFSPETLKLLQSVLEEAWDGLTPEEKAGTSKVQIASRILEVAARGERDPARLRNEAVSAAAALTMP